MGNDMKKQFLFAFILLFAMICWGGVGIGLAQEASATPAVAASATLAPSATSKITVTPTRSLTPTLTPLPAEYMQTPDQTTGIVFGAVFLVIIIVGGTFITLRRRR